VIVPSACKHRQRLLGTAPLRQTWNRPISKADGPPPPPDPDWLLAIADKAGPTVAAAFLEALRRVRNTIKEEMLRDAIERGDVAGAMRALGVEAELTDALKPGLTTPLEDVFIQAGRKTTARTLGVRAGMSFNLTNPHAATFLRNYDFGLIQQVSQDTRDGIRRVIEDAFKMGGHPYEQARKIRESLGLTENQAAAVDNFERMLRNKDRTALTRARRDRRHDPTLNRALGPNADRELTDEQITTMVNRYRNNTIRDRAETISRTETMRASNTAMQLAWRQAVDNGLLAGQDTRRYWLVTPDDRLCEYCEQVPDMNPDGVMLDGYFQTPFGPILAPPLHPNCRCITYIDQEEEDDIGDDDDIQHEEITDREAAIAREKQKQS
jgi:hypothetical protein